MAKSKYEYVKHFELADHVLPDTWMVVRIDGRGFHRLTESHNFVKPNDSRGLRLMNRCAEGVMREFPEIMLAYGQSDEYSFVFKKSARIFHRREAKITTNIVSLFASYYTYYWDAYLSHEPWTGDVDPVLTMDGSEPPLYGDIVNSNGEKLQYPPAFDARLVTYPSARTLRDYLCWRQADCHINNLYNTCNWMLVRKGGRTNVEAENDLRGTVSKDKMNEILFTEFSINYSKLPAMYRKGSCLIRENETVEYIDSRNGDICHRNKPVVNMLHADLIDDDFWKERPGLLE